MKIERQNSIIYSPIRYFLTKRFLEFRSQFPIRVPGLMMNPLRVSTDGGEEYTNMQSLQTEALSPDKSFGTSSCFLPQKPQLAEASIFVRN